MSVCLLRLAPFAPLRTVYGLLAILLAVATIAYPPAAVAKSPAPQSVLRIPSTAALPAQRSVTIGVDKAMIIELPVDSQDIIVSSSKTVDATIHTARRILLYGKELGNANVFVLGRAGQQVLVLDVNVRRDLSELRDMFKRYLPGSHITLAPSGKGAVISGSVAQPADAGRAEEMAKQFLQGGTVVNLLTAREKEQVLLKISVAEVQREAIRRLGVNLNRAITKAGAFTFTKVIANTFPVSTITAAAASYISQGTQPLVGAGTALQATANWNGNSATGIIEALERVGLARTLAEPTLTAISGESAKFLAGGEFPIPMSQKDNSLSVIFKKFGVSVAFTPFVLAEGRINLKVEAEVSELSNQGAVTLQSISIPALQVRRAETVVEMPSGSALAIAGLLSEQTRQNVDGVPGLRHVPVLGSLFRSKDFKNAQSELVILVTPYVVRPGNPDAFARPDKGFAPATGLRGLVHGHLHRIYKPSERLANEIRGGEYGFIVDYPEHGGLK